MRHSCTNTFALPGLHANIRQYCSMSNSTCWNMFSLSYSIKVKRIFIVETFACNSTETLEYYYYQCFKILSRFYLPRSNCQFLLTILYVKDIILSWLLHTNTCRKKSSIEYRQQSPPSLLLN